MKTIKYGVPLLAIAFYVATFLVGNSAGWPDPIFKIISRGFMAFIICWYVLHPLVAIVVTPCVILASIATFTMGSIAWIIVIPCVIVIILVISLYLIIRIIKNI